MRVSSMPDKVNLRERRAVRGEDVPAERQCLVEGIEDGIARAGRFISASRVAGRDNHYKSNICFGRNYELQRNTR